MSLAGGCSCGAIRYTVAENLSNRCFCHCRSCRRASGAPFVAWGTANRSEFDITHGELSVYVSSAKVQRGFCRQCGTSLTYANDANPQTLDIALATLDEPTLIKPEFHIWLENKLDWVVINDGLPTYPGWRTA